MRVAVAVADAFAVEGVTQVFGVMGDANLAWLHAATTDGKMSLIQPRHEAAAIAMADGFARVTGRTGVAAVTCGPGLTHAATSLAVAARYGSPLVVYTGDSPLSYHELGGIQEMDQRAVAAACGAEFVPVRTPATVAEDVRTAFDRARELRRPVVLNVATDLQEAEVPAWSYPARFGTAAVRFPDPAAAAGAAEAIGAARRPIVVMGRGLAGDQTQQARQLADAVGALTLVTLDGLNGAAEDPWFAGILGPFAHRTHEQLWRAADLIIALGSGLERFPTAVRASFPDQPTVAVGDDAARLGGDRMATYVVGGDTGPALTALARVIRPATGAGSRTDQARQVLDADARCADLDAAPAIEEAGRVDPRRAVMEVDAVLPHEVNVVVGAAHFWSFPNMFLRPVAGRRFFHTHDFGVIGQAMPTANGIAVACPRVPVVAFEGDGGLMQNLQELETAIRYQLPVLTVVVDDDGLGAEYHKLRARGRDAEPALIATPDLAAVARGLGGEGVVATDLATVRDTVADFADDPRPLVLDVKVARTVVSRSYGRAYFGEDT